VSTAGVAGISLSDWEPVRDRTAPFDAKYRVFTGLSDTPDVVSREESNFIDKSVGPSSLARIR
jgi:hypothetical protein